MGGIGSGRQWYYGANSTVEEYLALDIRALNRRGLINPGRCFDWSWSRNGERLAVIRIKVEHYKLCLEYRVTDNCGEQQELEYDVRLSFSACNFGGERAWFICPASGCTRRVGVLYAGRIFACRHCYSLAYSSQREDASDRVIRRADKIRGRLGWEPGILNDHGTKPKGMHWRTFFRLVDELDRQTDLSMGYITEKFRLLDRLGY